MKKNLLLITLSFLSINLTSQTAVLVNDYNEGADDGYDDLNYEAIPFNDAFLLPIYNEEHGLELGILENGMLSLLKDINPGDLSSDPVNFIEYKGKLYFTATTVAEKNAIWETDGTPEGTKLFVDPGSTSANPQGYIISKSGWLYYTYGSSLFRTDGTDNFNLGAATRFETYDNTSKNYSLYGDEIAFFTEIGNNNVFALYTVSGDQIVKQGEVQGSAGSDAASLHTVEGGLLIGITDNNDDIEGLYFWDGSTGLISKQSYNGLTRFPSRFIQFTEEKILMTVYPVAIFAVTRDSSVEISGLRPPLFPNGEKQTHAIKGDKVLLHGAEPNFQEKLLISDGTANGTMDVITTPSFISNMICYKNYAFTAGGISNNLNPEIHYYNFETEVTGVLHTFVEESAESNSIIFVGLQDKKVYFLCNLFPETGRELYYFDASSLTDLEDFPVDEDGDGVNADIDCDDNDNTVYPGAPEICDGKDNDCNSIVDEGLPFITNYLDADGDGFGDPNEQKFYCEVLSGYATNNDDCDDSNPEINPGANEITYNGLDDDCNSFTPDDDLDEDGYGIADDCDDTDDSINPDATEVTYNGVDEDCDPSTPDDDLDGDGYVLAEDCNDDDSSVNPGTSEIPYNGVDDDCNAATVDDDVDGDGFGIADDCDDNNDAINPAATEQPYNGLDDDCDAATLDDDLDGDGFVLADDCDDTDAGINPDATEIADNGIDEDCDGMDLEVSTHEISNTILNIYPNPAKDYIRIDVDGSLNYAVGLYDLTGRLIRILKNAEILDVSDVGQGTYFIKISDLNSTETVVERIVVVK